MVTAEMILQVDLFEGISEALAAKIAEIASERTCARGEMILFEGEKAEALHVLLEGKVSIKVSMTSRPANVTAGVIDEPFRAFGWSGLVAPFYHTASVLSEEKTRVLVIPGDKLMALLESEPDCGFVVMRKLTELIGNRLRNSRMVLVKSL